MIDRTKYLEEDEIKQLRNSTEAAAALDLRKGRKQCVITWMVVDLVLGTGVRVSELAKLKIEDTDFKRGLIRVHRTHEIIDKAPYDYFRQNQGDSGIGRSCSKVDDWTWLEEEPKEWRPSVCKKNTKTITTFYSFSGLGTEAIYRHIGTFQAGTYVFKAKRVNIAEGVGGYIT